ncbi:MAG: T9SS type A sorting domain-containing protein, partial [Bacteroidales bacterium]|nr:T9SS type A sorting domain-containing protein [Bacteroidales bacterium]
ANDLLVYPNPAGNLLNIDLQKNINETDISIYSMTGVLVQKHDDLSIPESGRISLSLEHLPEGQYVLLVENGAKSFTKRFIIIR